MLNIVWIYYTEDVKNYIVILWYNINDKTERIGLEAIGSLE